LSGMSCGFVWRASHGGVTPAERSLGSGDCVQVVQGSDDGVFVTELDASACTPNK
jgi:hypothetical protein